MKKNIIIVALIVSVLLVGLSIARCISDNTPPPFVSGPPVVVNQAYVQAFLTAPWDGNDAPYKTARDEMASRLLKSPPDWSVISAYKDAALHAPKDPLAQYRWAYAAVDFTYQPHSFSDKLLAFQGVSNAIVSNPFPRTYNYARIEFLVVTRGWQYSPLFFTQFPSLDVIGQRLLAIDPKDLPVERAQVRCLFDNKAPDSEAKALTLLAEITKQDPDNPNNDRLMGSIHLDAYDTWHSPADGKAAREAYQRYVQRTDSSDEFHNQAMLLVKMLNTRLAKQQ